MRYFDRLIHSLFRFSSPQTVSLEEGREARLKVVRLQGSFRKVRVFWNVSSGAFPDIYPANGTLAFPNVSSRNFFTVSHIQVFSRKKHSFAKDLLCFQRLLISVSLYYYLNLIIIQIVNF